MKLFGSGQCLADTCVVRFDCHCELEKAVVGHVGEIFYAGGKCRGVRFGTELNADFPVKFFGELRMSARIHFSPYPAPGELVPPQKLLAGAIAAKLRMTRSEATSMAAGMVSPFLDSDDKVDMTISCYLLGSSMWLANQTQVDNVNAA